MGRLTFIDGLRGVALILMVLNHTSRDWMDGAVMGWSRYYLVYGSLLFPAAIFLFLAGFSLPIGYHRRQVDEPLATRARRYLRRGIGIVGAGYLLNVLITLDDSHEGNGCFRVIRGSHRRGVLPGRAGEGRLGPLLTHPSAFDATAEIAEILPAGSAVFFSAHSVHVSEPNFSDEARRAIVLTYQPAGKRMFKVDQVRECGTASG